MTTPKKGTVKNLLAPKLRFKEFKDSWLKKKLGEIAQITTGSTPSTSVAEYYNGDYPFVSPADISETRFVNTTKTTVTELGFEQGRLIPKGSILFVCIGSTIGKVGQAARDCITNQQINSLEADKQYSNDFIYSLLEKNGKEIRLLAGTQAVPQINKSTFSNLKFYFPSLPEQQKIASFLSAVDEKIQQLTRKKELLEQYKKGAMQQLFAPPSSSELGLEGLKDDRINPSIQKSYKSKFRPLRFKDANGKPYPKWEEKRLGEIGDIVSGLTYSPDNVSDTGVLVLRSSNVQNRQIVFDDNVFVNVSSDEFNPVQENDILICVRNGSRDLIGKNAIIGKESVGLAFGAFMTVFRSKYNQYLFHFFDTDSYKKAVHRNLGATINSINGGELKKFKVPFPSLEEQQKIASFLTALDAKIESINRQIAQTQTFKKGLLQQMFV